MLQFRRNAVRAHVVSSSQTPIISSAWHHGPDNAALVPPQSILGGDPSILYSAGRRQKATTEFDLLQWRFSTKDNRLTLSIERLTFNGNAIFDKNASWVSFLVANGLPSVASLNHRSSNQIGFGLWGTKPYSGKAYGEDVMASLRKRGPARLNTNVPLVNENPSLQAQIKNNDYRFLHHEPVLLSTADQTTMLVFGRGVASHETSRASAKYRLEDERYLGVWAIPIAPYARNDEHEGHIKLGQGTLTSLAISQDAEPLVATRIKDDQRLLLGLQKTDNASPCKYGRHPPKHGLHLVAWNLDSKGPEGDCFVIPTSTELAAQHVRHPPALLAKNAQGDQLWVDTQVQETAAHIEMTWTIREFVKSQPDGRLQLKTLGTVNCKKPINIGMPLTQERKEALEIEKRRWLQPKILIRFIDGGDTQHLYVTMSSNLERIAKSMPETPDGFNWSVKITGIEAKEPVTVDSPNKPVLCEHI